MLVLPTGEGWSGDEGVYLGLARNITHGFYRDGSADGPLNMCLPGWKTPDRSHSSKMRPSTSAGT